MLPPRAAAAGLRCGLLTVLTGAEAGGVWVVGPHGLVVGRAPTANLVVESSAVSRHHARFGAGPNGTFWVEDLGSTNGTFLGSRRITWSALACGDMIWLGPDFRLRFSMADESEATVRRQMYESAVRDPLTAAFNRRYFLQRLATELQQVELTHGDVAVLMIDVDDLKRLNDEHGHLVGDRALCVLAQAILNAVRGGDVVARYGGDEFAVLAPGADVTQGNILAARVRQTLASRRFAAGGTIVQLSASVGVASLLELGRPGSLARDLLALADSRLYEAKRARASRLGTQMPKSTDRPRAANMEVERTEVRRRTPFPPPRGLPD